MLSELCENEHAEKNKIARTTKAQSFLTSLQHWLTSLVGLSEISCKGTQQISAETLGIFSILWSKDTTHSYFV